MRMRVEELRLEGSAERIDELTLDAHQAELRDAVDPLVLLEAPAGAGKTLACLLRVLRRDVDAIFVYPTRELIADQERQILGLLRALGRVAGAVGEPGADVQVLAVDSARLEREARGRPHGVVLDQMLARAERGRLLLLTNPDVLFAIIQSRYARSRFLWGALSRFRLLVVDEVHLYWGVSLAHLCFMLHLLRDLFEQVILSTATWSSEPGLFEAVVGHPARRVRARPGQGRVVRHPVDLELRAAPDRPLGTEEDLETVLKVVRALDRERRPTEAEVSVLAIVDSVVFAEELYRSLTRSMGPIDVAALHGLVPPPARRRAPVVVGTSAIEVGVDFDAASGTFEARSASTFLQRLGRIGRRRPGQAVAFVPAGALEAFSTLLAGRSSIDHSELERVAQRALEPSEAHEGFVKSPEGLLALTAFLHSVVSGLEGESGVVTVSRCIAEDSRLHFPLWPAEAVLSAYDEWGLPVIRAVAQGGFRGHAVQVPALFEEYGVRGELSIFDLHKVDGEWRDGRLVVRGIRRGHRWRLNLQDRRVEWGRSIGVLRRDRFSVLCDPPAPDLEATMAKLAEGLPCFVTPELLDWRLPWATCASSSRRAYLGAGALVAHYLSERPSR